MVSSVDPDDARGARLAALQLLGRRDHCAAELASRLKDRGYSDSVVDTLVEALKRERLLDDERFAENFVSYRAARGQGPMRIARELRSLGIASDLIGRFVEERDWTEEARRVRRKRFGAALPGSRADKAKQARFLQYRGFTGSQVRLVLGTDVDIDEGEPDFGSGDDDER